MRVRGVQGFGFGGGGGGWELLSVELDPFALAFRVVACGVFEASGLL